MRAKRFFSLVIIVCALAAAQCEPDATDGRGDRSFARQGLGGIPEREPNLYLRCNSTGWGLGDQTRLKSAADAEVMTLTYEVRERYMTEANGGDSCVLTESAERDHWDGVEHHRTAMERFQVPSRGLALVSTGSQEETFHVVYPGPGRYTATYNTGTHTLAFHSADSAPIEPFKGELTIRIRAYIDGRDRLVLKGSTLQWQHFDFAAVGRHQGVNEPTIITTARDDQPVMKGVSWFPRWPEDPPAEIRYEATSSVFKLLQPAMPAQQVVVALHPKQSRVKTRIVERPSQANDFALIVEFDDNEAGGPAWYEAALILSSPAPLAARWAFDGNAQDRSGHRNHAAVFGATLAKDRAGLAAMAYRFDGVEDHLMVPNSKSLQIGKSDYTITAWIKTKNAGNDGRIYSKGSSYCTTGYMMRLGGDRVHLENAKDEQCLVFLDGEKVVTDGAWHFVAGVVDRDRGATLYVDGDVDVTQEINTAAYDLSNSVNAVIGADHDNQAEYFDGSIDELRIYRKALSRAEVRALFLGHF